MFSVTVYRPRDSSTISACSPRNSGLLAMARTGRRSSAGRAGCAAAGHERLRKRACSGTVTSPSNAAKTMKVLRQPMAAVRLAVSGANIVEAKPATSVSVVSGRTLSRPYQRLITMNAGW